MAPKCDARSRLTGPGTPPGRLSIAPSHARRWRHEPPLLALGLIWLAHIGGDRLPGFGLKYDDQFQHTHLSQPGGTS